MLIYRVFVIISSPGGNEAGYFVVDQTTCVVSLQSSLPEGSSEYNLILFVRDNSVPPNNDMMRVNHSNTCLLQDLTNIPFY